MARFLRRAGYFALALAGFWASTALAGTRYEGAALHAIVPLLLLSGAAMTCAALAARRCVRSGSRPMQIAVALALAVPALAFLIQRQIGFDGILLRADGTQIVGAWALYADADLFGLAAIAALFLSKGAFARK